nr:uncharacterized protein LOC111419819 [Onthophagus taurus]
MVLFGIYQTECSPSFYNPYYRTYPYVQSSYQYNIPEVIPQAIPPPQTFYENVPILPPPSLLPPLNILAESPSSISTSFTVVPMVLVAKENMNMISEGKIMKISKEKPEMTLKINKTSNLLQATPAVKISLDQPILVYSVRSEILFPSNIEIVHQGYKLPIRIGSIIAPVDYHAFINNYNQGPIQLNEVFAVPAEPVKIDYVNNDKGVIIKPEDDAVIIENNSNLLTPSKNVTVLIFPTKEDEPLLIPDEEDDELVNRNPPIVLAPGGISASLQPTIVESPFENSKESFILQQLREEALKRY